MRSGAHGIWVGAGAGGSPPPPQGPGFVYADLPRSRAESSWGSPGAVERYADHVPLVYEQPLALQTGACPGAGNMWESCRPRSAREPKPYSYVPVGADTQTDGTALTGDDRNACLASGKALTYLNKMEATGSLGLESASVYGAAVALPQIARSALWSRSMTGFAIRSYLFLLINMCIQFFLLSMLGESLHIMTGFAGTPHLCDFGAVMEDCPDGPNCRGPGGTTFSFPRLYDFSTWSTRTFVRDSLKKIFPEKSEEIQSVADPGEYGLENYYCRLVCCFIFQMSVMDEFRSCLNLGKLLWRLPAEPEKWIRYETPAWENKERVKQFHGLRELDFVKFGVAGMPRFWKLMNVCFVLMPKIGIWLVVAKLGTEFLMETAGIVDVIMSCVAMNFILSIDELIFATLTTLTVKHMMERMEAYELFSVHEDEKTADEEVVQRFCREEFGSSSWFKFAKLLNPKRLVFTLVFMACFYWLYYRRFCQQAADGSWISTPVHTVANVRYNPLSFIFPLKIFGWTVSPEPVWSMPEDY